MSMNTFTVSWFNYATESNYPTTGAADTLYTNDANDTVKYWDTNNNAYFVYVGPHPHH